MVQTGENAARKHGITTSEQNEVTLLRYGQYQDAKANGTDKYNLSQGDFYQLQAYGQSCLGGKGELFLVFPGNRQLDAPLPLFEFPAAGGLRLWVVPFDLRNERLHVPAGADLANWQ